MSLQSHEIQTRLATRRVEVFNQRYSVGAAVMYIAGPGEEPQWDRTFGLARVQAGRSIVQLAGRECPVDTDKLYSPPIEVSHVRCPEARLPLWKLTTAFILGFTAAVVFALAMPPAKAVYPERIVIDCEEPGEMTAEEGSATA